MGGYYGGAPRRGPRARARPGRLRPRRRSRRSRASCGPARPTGPVDVHLKVDTGMARLGVTMRELAAFAERSPRIPEVRVRGLMTHLACADAPTPRGDDASRSLRFDEATALLARHGVRAGRAARRQQRRAPPRGGAARRGSPRARALRRLAACGRRPARERAPPGDARSHRGHRRARASKRATPSATARSGARRALRASRPCRWATPTASRASSPTAGHVLVRGKRAPIVGAVSMDMSMIDVTDFPGVARARRGRRPRRPRRARSAATRSLRTRSPRTPGRSRGRCSTSISRRVPRFYREP